MINKDEDSGRPLISILVNCYNGEEHLRQALESIISQTYENWEIIFWDNQSTDHSADIAKSFKEERLKYYFAPRHTTLYEARNYAVEKVIGQWIAFLDCDDFWEKDKLERQLALAGNADAAPGIIYGRSRIIDEFENEMVATYANRELPEGMIHKELLRINFIPLLTVLVRSDLYREVGGARKEFTLIGDYYLWLKISRNYAVKAVQENVATYRWHSNNLSNRKNHRMMYELLLLKLVYFKFLQLSLIYEALDLWIWAPLRRIGRRLKGFLKQIL